MIHLITGTQDARGEHSTGRAILGATIACGMPFAIAIAGIARYGWSAVSWAGGLGWGALAALVFVLFTRLGEDTGVTKMDLLDLLGSLFASPHTRSSRTIGFIVHLIDGALLGVAYAYGLLLGRWPATWLTGLIWGVILWVLSLILLTSIGGVHPAIRKNLEGDPGTAAVNFGKMTPLGTLIGHAIYGVILGVLYNH